MIRTSIHTAARMVRRSASVVGGALRPCAYVGRAVVRRCTLVGGLALILCTCDTGVDPSPDPGVIRLLLEADAADSVVVIGSKRYALGNDTTSALMRIRIGQALIYRDTTYAALYRRLNSFQIQDPLVDVLETDSEGSLSNHLLFESYLPPAAYDSLQLAMHVNLFRIQTLGRVTFNTFENEVRLPPGASPVLTFRQPFDITSRDTTVVQLRIRPLQSLTRYQDVYYFTPEVEIEDIELRR